MATSVEYIEEFIHTSEGELKSKDPYSHYLVVGNKVRMINSEKASVIACDVRQGAIGIITEDAKRKTERMDRDSRGGRVYVRWSNLDLLKDRGQGDPSGSTIYYCLEDCVEPA